MKSVLISIQPKWCELIALGKKTIEIRKTKPKLETPFKCYIYCTKGEPIYLPRDIFGKEALNGKVIGEFVCDSIESFSVPYPAYFSEVDSKTVSIMNAAFLSPMQIHAYNGVHTTYAWHISDLVIYDKPKELSAFSKYGFGRPVPIKRPPQSWMYVEELQ